MERSIPTFSKPHIVFINTNTVSVLPDMDACFLSHFHTLVLFFDAFSQLFVVNAMCLSPEK